MEVDRHQNGKFHELKVQFEEISKYPKGRPSAGQSRTPSEIKHKVKLMIAVNQDALSNAEK
jgi:hypothetical protein